MKKQILDEIFHTSQISLSDILLCREQRVQNQQRLMKSAGQGTLISFTLNIVGAVKSAPLFSKAFREGKRRILRQLSYQGARVILQEEYSKITGDELYLVTDEDIVTVKRLMTEIEESFAMGRLFDIDVMSTDKVKISRQELGFAPRKCLVCEEQAAACARSQKHSINELMEKTVEIIWNYFEQDFAATVAQNACRALLYEVAAAPKPGLVDRENNGSHKDMDCFTFIDSACTLFPYFWNCTRKGIEMSEDLPQLFAQLRCLGKEAEDKMKTATGGVNTHKGAIFSMGIICAAVGVLEGRDNLGLSIHSCKRMDCEAFTEQISKVCRELCSSLTEDFAHIKNKAKSSYGEKLYLQYGITGIRGEASEGFPSVFKVGLPCLKHQIEKGHSLNDAGVVTLLALMQQVQDSNIIARSDMDTLLWVQRRAKELLDTGTKMEGIREFDREMIQKNISPGGCADLLALSYFLYFCQQSITP